MALVPERPRLRPTLAAEQDRSDARYVFLWDQLRPANGRERLTLLEYTWLRFFDGRRTLGEIHLEAIRQLGGEPLPLDWFTTLAQRLDQAHLLSGPVRDASCAPYFADLACGPLAKPDPIALRHRIANLFTGPGGSGLPRAGQPDGRLRAALLPHIDYPRGGATYTWGFKEIFERADASLFVIVGTSHYSLKRFTLTRQDFETPLGIARTDQRFIDRLETHYGNGLFDDPVAHLPEHSIELEVVFLQFLYEGRRPFRIVPLVVGSFQDCLDGRGAAGDRPDIARMVEALRRAEAECEEPVCYVISGDLAHIGPKFGDLQPVNDAWLNHSRQQDHALLQRAEAVDTTGYLRIVAGEKDQRRICGLPPTCTVLEAARPVQGKLLHYDQYVHPQGYESVSFASLAFYR
jgi:AmmeMemoRadiSam system protein B